MMACQLSSILLRIFQKIKERKVTFVIDTSGSMYYHLDLVKNSVMKLVHLLLHSSNSSCFNVISLSKANNFFSDSVVPSTKKNISLLSTWLSTLKCESQTNTLSALISAFNDENSDAVILISDAIPDQKKSVIVNCIKELAQYRPLHVICIRSQFNEEKVIDFWKDLVISTDGTMHILRNDNNTITYLEENEALSNYFMSDDSSDESQSVNIKHILSKENKKINLQMREKMKSGFKKSSIGSILVREQSDGYYYEGKPIERISIHKMLVSSCGLQKEISDNDFLNLSKIKEKTIHEGDHVLVKTDGKKYVPAKVLKKNYEFNPNDDNLDFDKTLDIVLYGGENITVSYNTAAHISSEQYNDCVTGIFQKQIKKVNDGLKLIDHKFQSNLDKAPANVPCLDSCDCCSPRKIQAYSDEVLPKKSYKQKPDYLREKIEKQLAESVEFLNRLGLTDETSCDYDDYRQSNMLCGSLNIPYTKRLLESVSEESSNVLSNSYPTLKGEPRPPPPRSWTYDDMKGVKKKSKRRYRSASVGSNIVERSKKHWIGRPISRETTPKRPFNEHVRVVPSKKVPPQAEEYQTTDGVPFPRKTDNKFYRPIIHNGSWLPDSKPMEPYQHQDIIAHRLVQYAEKQENIGKPHYDRKTESDEKNRVNALRNNRAIRERREQAKKKEWKMQLKERDEQIRKMKEEQEERGYTKLKITIEKDRSKLENKQRQYDDRKRFEKEREERNQSKKHERIEAMKERKQNYPQLKEENYRCLQGEKTRENRTEKRAAAEQKRIMKEIEQQEAKLNRLKKLRKQTDARFDSLRRGNDEHRDISTHVNDLNKGRVRAEILP